LFQCAQCTVTQPLQRGRARETAAVGG
jgi:hypothetical protein